ncbi:MAG TPA: hypothetical protein PLV09_00020 [Candidatus Omnitrophota bacterium]|nr:hypothetical protein [Candidatus Omnitrophota bacterium]HOX09573.1 hypothetical protein [Candidatus Omnitrophota bacterium]HPN65792.1 hypothetical protein [Candidatus Omnitrophota bacterium]HRZ67018.1 hypothetical protein [Candidatus Omnitrophota bacterium]
MKVYKFLIMTVSVTAVALVYVTQQTSLIRLSYDIKAKEQAYSELLDRNKILLYNVRQLESPARLEKTLLAKNVKMEVPSKERFILLSSAQGYSAADNAVNAGAVGFFGRVRQTVAGLFALGPEAQAKPLK